MIQVHSTAKISPLADIENSVKGSNIIIEEDTQIDSFVKIKVAGGMGDFLVGKNCYINSGCLFYTGNGIKIGNNVLIAGNTTFAPVNHEYKSGEMPIYKQRFKPSKGGIVIEDDVWIGSNCTLLDGTYIHEGVVIGAQSLVKGEIPAYSVNAGNPLRNIGYRER